MSGNGSAPALFLFSITLAVLALGPFHVNFRISLLILIK